MRAGRLFGEGRSQDDDQWLSVSDLMAGLMVIFLFIAITYIRPIVEMQDTIREIVVAWKHSEFEIYKALEAEFRDDLPKWGADLDQETLSIRFKSPEVLFDSATAILKLEFQEILSDFFPRYIKLLYEFRDAIDEVRIEGHTSSAWIGAQSAREAYFRNMELSQARTRAVLEYSLDLEESAQFEDWARKLITANGLSSSQLIMTADGEDPVRSRRVEFRVRTNSKEQIVRVLETIE